MVGANTASRETGNNAQPFVVVLRGCRKHGIEVARLNSTIIKKSAQSNIQIVYGQYSKVRPPNCDRVFVHLARPSKRSTWVGAYICLCERHWQRQRSYLVSSDVKSRQFHPVPVPERPSRGRHYPKMHCGVNGSHRASSPGRRARALATRRYDSHTSTFHRQRASFPIVVQGSCYTFGE